MALEFFKAAGATETVAQGATIFTEKQKASSLLRQQYKMYLLEEGEVMIQAAGKAIGAVHPGEIFGELAPLTSSARSAAAIAKTPCRLISLDEKQFLDQIQQQPWFALMLMSVIIGRLRGAVARARAAQALAEEKDGRESSVFDRKLLRDLQRRLGNPSPMRVLRQQAIFQEGGAGMLVYVVLEGRVQASIDGKTVERIGPGGVIGEVALVDQEPRVASVKAETDCLLLPIDRKLMLELVQTQPEFGVSLLRALAARLRFLIVGPRRKWTRYVKDLWQKGRDLLKKRDPW
jgi:CRP-like cAMP-binding protein